MVGWGDQEDAIVGMMGLGQILGFRRLRYNLEEIGGLYAYLALGLAMGRGFDPASRLLAMAEKAFDGIQRCLNGFPLSARQSSKHNGLEDLNIWLMCNHSASDSGHRL